MRRRTILSCMVVAGTVAGVSAAGVSPAAAQTVPQWTVVGGNFTGDARDESFWYLPGGDTDDVLVSSSNGGVPGGDLQEVEYPYNVVNSYRPFAGDFDGDGYDELFWYAPGSAGDSIWNFSATDPTVRTSTPTSVSGTYTPLVGDFNADGVDDIFWYGSGTAPDSMWYFNPGGSHVSAAVNVRGVYRPTVASIGKDATDDIVWYGPGPTADSVWDFTAGTHAHTSFPLTINGTAFRPIGLDAFGEGPRSEDVWLYSPGSANDPFWDYVNGVRQPQFSVPLGGNWRVAVGDYFGDGQQDVYVSDINVGFTLRDFTTIDGVPSYVDYNFRFDAAAASASSLGERSKGTVEASEPHAIG